MKVITQHIPTVALIGAILTVPFISPQPQIVVPPAQVEVKSGEIRLVQPMVCAPHSDAASRNLSPDLCCATIQWKVKGVEVELEIAKDHAEHTLRLRERCRRLLPSGAVSPEANEQAVHDHKRAVLEVARLEYRLKELQESLKWAEKAEDGR